ncbi:MAG: hypothetical protein HOP04_13225 [Methylophilaceae bacterium]|nr:hypothetical protein [Methylophilaceae bacterium]
MFERTFFHIDEFGSAGMAYLPSILTLNRSTVLWSPAPMLLDHSHNQGSSIIGTEELLKLLRKRIVRIIGRRNWFDRSWRNRAGAWEFAKWQDDFDNEVCAMANEDANEPLSNRRVIIAPDEQGFERAELLLKQDPVLVEKLTSLLSHRQLPQGILEKAERAKRQGRGVEVQILRDAFNHQQAIIDADARSATVPDTFMNTLVALIKGLEPTTATDNLLPADESCLRDALDLLRAVRAPTSFESLEAFLSSGARDDLVSLLCSNRAAGSLPDSIIWQIEQATKIRPVLDRLFPSRDPVGYSSSLATFVSTLASLISSGASVGLITIPFQVCKGWLQERSLVPLEVDKKYKVKPLFQLAIGTDRPKKDEVEALLIALRHA